MAYIKVSQEIIDNLRNKTLEGQQIREARYDKYGVIRQATSKDEPNLWTRITRAVKGWASGLRGDVGTIERSGLFSDINGPNIKLPGLHLNRFEDYGKQLFIDNPNMSREEWKAAMTEKYGNEVNKGYNYAK